MKRGYLWPYREELQDLPCMLADEPQFSETFYVLFCKISALKAKEIKLFYVKLKILKDCSQTFLLNSWMCMVGSHNDAS